MREANDLKISAAIRRELSSRRIDLSKLKFPVKAGEVTLEGELSFVGLEKTPDEIAIELKFIETSIKCILGVSKINFEITNWKKNDTGIWEAVGSSNGSLFKSLDGEGLVCPECDFVIRFCPCCGKPLVPGAKPGMHKGGISKSVPRRPNIPPIKPIARKPRPIGGSSPLPVSGIKSNLPSSGVDTGNKPVVSPNIGVAKTVTSKPVVGSNLNKEQKLDNNTTVKPVVSKLTTDLNNNEKKLEEKVDTNKQNSISSSSLDTKLDKPSLNTPSTAVPPKPLKPLRPLKPLAGLKPINKPSATVSKPVTETPKLNAVKPTIPESKPIESSGFDSVPELSNINNSDNTVVNTPLNTGTSDFNQVSVSDNSTSNLISETSHNTPLPNFMLNSSEPQTNQNMESNLDSQIPNLNIDMNPFGSDNSQQSSPVRTDPFALNNVSEPQLPDMGLNLGTLESNLNTPPASGQPSDQLPDLGLNLGTLESNLNTPLASDQSSSQLPDLGMNLGTLDSSFDSSASQNNNMNQGFGNMDNGMNPVPNASPDLDLGLGFDMGANIPTSPAPSSLSDLGLNMPNANEPPVGQNLNSGFDIPDLSSSFGNTNIPQNDNQNIGMGAANSDGNSLDLFGGMNLNDLGNNESSSAQGGFDNQMFGNTQPSEDTSFPQVQSEQQGQASSGFSFDNLDYDDTPLPPMRPAQTAAPKTAAPAKKKSDDLFASLFNDSNLSGNGQDGLGNMDLDLEIFPSGTQEPQLQSQSNSANQQPNGGDNPFNLGDSFLDLDSMLDSGNNGAGNAGNIGGKDSSGAFNLDDFDINNFKL